MCEVIALISLPLRIQYPTITSSAGATTVKSVFRDDHDRKRSLGKLSLYCEEKEVGMARLARSEHKKSGATMRSALLITGFLVLSDLS